MQRLSVRRAFALMLVLAGTLLLSVSFVSKASAYAGGSLLIRRCDSVCDDGCKDKNENKCATYKSACKSSPSKCDGCYCKFDDYDGMGCWCYK